MTKAEFDSLKKGDRIRHIVVNEVSVIDSDKTQYGYFHRPEFSTMGWNTINEKTYHLYELIVPDDLKKCC